MREFVERIDALEPPANRSPVASVDIRFGSERVSLQVSAPAAAAMAEALHRYQDPRDRGGCGHCGGRRLDDNFVCRDCGRPNGVFGRLLVERAASFRDATAIAGPGRDTVPEQGP